jgi:protein-tyrosine phosphatase
MKSILVVCEGNICRSPMAEGLLAAALPQMQVRSAGLNALSGMPADETAVRLMLSRGIDIAAHRALQITRELCLHADLVLVMSADQRKRLEKMYPAACGRVFRLGEYSKFDVPDPFRQAEKAFRESLQLIEKGVREWLQRIQKI